MSKMIARFAPSPTGNLHIGSARTALINFICIIKVQIHLYIVAFVLYFYGISLIYTYVYNMNTTLNSSLINCKTIINIDVTGINPSS